ncbi:MAG: hypothetical protein JOZ51_01135 [Chloroflexi bacterium]|nr:hypothetical protein [Chloroflexota bacterium]
MKHKIQIDIFIGKKCKIRSWSPPLSTTDVEISKYGSLWGERQVLDLGPHYNLYSQYGAQTWDLQSQATLTALAALPEELEPTPYKLPGGSVSGNFGEVLTILALETRILPRPLTVCHLCPKPGFKRLKCPDLMLETAPLQPEYAVFQQSFQSSFWPEDQLPQLPDFIPGECKNADFNGALQQLATYWRLVKEQSLVFGFGLISQIDYKKSRLELHILVPRDRAALASVIMQSDFDPKTLKPAHIAGSMYGFKT